MIGTGLPLAAGLPGDVKPRLGQPQAFGTGLIKLAYAVPGGEGSG